MNQDETEDTLTNMTNYGGDFIKALSRCYRRADHFNRAKLLIAFPEYFAEYGKEHWSNRKN